MAFDKIRRASTVVALVVVAAGGGAARAAPSAAQTAADVERLEKEVRELRELVLRTEQMSEQRYEFLLKLVQSGGAVPAGTTLPAPPARAPVSGAAGHDNDASPARAANTGTVSGTLTITGAAAGPAYVYIEDIRGPAVRGPSIEISQRDKQFHPQVAAVARGTRLIFPNTDPVSHNVFSPSTQQPFDVGMTPAGQLGAPVTLLSPGVFELFCSIHSQMWAQVLVVPNVHFAKVGSDGRFRLAGVPLGTHTLAAWTPNAKPARVRVVVSATGTDATLTLVTEGAKAHNNKFGQPYGSYNE